MVCEEGSHRLGPPSKKAPKEGGYPPIPPLLGWVERARDLGKRWVYREPGKARFMSLQMAYRPFVVHVWFLYLRHRKVWRLT